MPFHLVVLMAVGRICIVKSNMSETASAMRKQLVEPCMSFLVSTKRLIILPIMPKTHRVGVITCVKRTFRFWFGFCFSSVLLMVLLTAGDSGVVLVFCPRGKVVSFCKSVCGVVVKVNTLVIPIVSTLNSRKMKSSLIWRLFNIVVLSFISGYCQFLNYVFYCLQIKLNIEWNKCFPDYQLMLSLLFCVIENLAKSACKM